MIIITMIEDYVFILCIVLIITTVIVIAVKNKSLLFVVSNSNKLPIITITIDYFT